MPNLLNRKNLYFLVCDCISVEAYLVRYVAMRKLGGNKKTITATPRQLESLVRLSEALAKMRLSQRVERSDVIEATRLMRVALQQVFFCFCFVFYGNL